MTEPNTYCSDSHHIGKVSSWWHGEIGQRMQSTCLSLSNTCLKTKKRPFCFLLWMWPVMCSGLLLLKNPYVNCSLCGLHKGNNFSRVRQTLPHSPSHFTPIIQQSPKTPHHSSKVTFNITKTNQKKSNEKKIQTVQNMQFGELHSVPSNPSQTYPWMACKPLWRDSHNLRENCCQTEVLCDVLWQSGWDYRDWSHTYAIMYDYHS